MANLFKKAVFLSNEFPYPFYGGAKMRDAHFIRLLMEKMDVELLCLSQSPELAAGRELARDPSVPPGLRISFIDRGRSSTLRRTMRRAINPFRPEVVSGSSPSMLRALEMRAEPPATLLWVSRMTMAQYVPEARRLGYTVILDEQNIETELLIGGALAALREGQAGHVGVTLSTLKNVPHLLTAAQCSFYESRFCGSSNAVVTTSDLDASRLMRIAPSASVHVIPNSVDCSIYEPVRSMPGTTLLFFGSLNNPANIEGLTWFANEVMPRLKGVLGAHLPRVVAAGASPSAETRRILEHSGIEVHADPPSTLPYLSEAMVVFVPMRSGGSSRVKILEAMAAGRPVVSTGKGAEGLVLAPGYDIWIADRADGFATGILQLLQNQQLRTDLGSHAIRTVETRYDWKCARDMVSNLLESLAPKSDRSA